MTSLKHYAVDSSIIYDPAVYDAQNNFDYDIPFYKKLARKAKGAVLEFCCGTGRITLALAHAGIDVTGIDFTPSMLKRARQKADQLGLSVPLFSGDMRRIRLNRKFNLVFIPFNSLQNTYTLSDIEMVFRTVQSHLKPDGRFAFDIFNPSIHYMAKYERMRKGLYRFKTEDGRRVVIDQRCHYDAAGQVNRATWIHHVGTDALRTARLDMRCFYPLEMDALLKYNGFKVLRKYGSFEEDPFTSESLKQIYVCKKA